MIGATTVARRDAVHVIAVDVGGTSTRVRFASTVATDRDDRRHLELPGARITGAGLNVGNLVEAVRAGIDRSSSVLGEPTHVALCIGSTGLPDLVGDMDELRVGLHMLGVDRAVLAADVVTAHFGALGGAPGVVLAAGTGAVALGTDLRDDWHRVDGWGHLLGDDGAGSSIGMSGLRAAFRALDGRIDGSDELRRRAEQRFGALDDLVRTLYTADDRAAAMASFVPDVVAAAADGDGIAGSIVQRAGEHLADTAVAAAHRSGQRTVAHTGRLFDAGPLLTDPLRERLRSVADLQLHRPLGTPLDGAMALARLAAGDPAGLPRPRNHLITTIGDAT